jgi:hypothetical protein
MLIYLCIVSIRLVSIFYSSTSYFEGLGNLRLKISVKAIPELLTDGPHIYIHIYMYKAVLSVATGLELLCRYFFLNVIICMCFSLQFFM